MTNEQLFIPDFDIGEMDYLDFSQIAEIGDEDLYVVTYYHCKWTKIMGYIMVLSIH